VDALNDRSGTAMDMQMFFQFFTTDIMFDLAFGGHGPQLVKAGKDATGMFEAMESYLQIITTIGNVPSLTPLAKLLPPDPKVEKFVQFSDQCYEARAQDPSPSPDIFQYLVSVRNSRPIRYSPKTQGGRREPCSYVRERQTIARRGPIGYCTPPRSW